MYSINSVPLDNPSMGWTFRAQSKPLSAHTRDRQTLSAAGRDGVIQVPGATFGPVGLSLVVETPRARLEDLVALFAEDGHLSLTDAPTRTARFEFLASSPVGYGDADELVDVTFTIRLIDAAWRALTERTFTTPLAASEVSLDVFPGLSSPVQDAVLQVRGPVTSLRVTDSSGAWVSYSGLPGLPADQWLRIEGRRAFTTTTAAWVGGTDVSGLLRVGGPRRRFEITPLRGATPDVRVGRLTINTLTRGASASIAVRGRSAHLQAER